MNRKRQAFMYLLQYLICYLHWRPKGEVDARPGRERRWDIRVESVSLEFAAPSSDSRRK